MNKIKLGTAVFAFLACLGAGSMSTYAKVNSVLVNDTSSQKVYEYNYSNLADSFVASKMGEAAPLYNDYYSKIGQFGVYAIYDDTNKFVDYAKISEAFADAKALKQPFNIDEFTSSDKAPLLQSNPASVFDAAYTNGSISYTEKKISGGPTNPDSSDFQVIGID